MIADSTVLSLSVAVDGHQQVNSCLLESGGAKSNPVRAGYGIHLPAVLDATVTDSTIRDTPTRIRTHFKRRE